MPTEYMATLEDLDAKQGGGVATRTGMIKPCASTIQINTTTTAKQAAIKPSSQKQHHHNTRNTAQTHVHDVDEEEDMDISDPDNGPIQEEEEQEENLFETHDEDE